MTGFNDENEWTSAPDHAARRTLVADRGHALELARFDFPDPTLQVSIEPESKADLDKLGQALTRMLEEEPSVRVRREEGTGETVLTEIAAHVAYAVLSCYVLQSVAPRMGVPAQTRGAA